jgi:hypothetical protein
VPGRQDLGDERFALSVSGDAGEHDDEVGIGVTSDEGVERGQLQLVVGLDTESLLARIDLGRRVEVLTQQSLEVILDRGHAAAGRTRVGDEENMHERWSCLLGDSGGVRYRMCRLCLGEAEGKRL